MHKKTNLTLMNTNTLLGNMSLKHSSGMIGNFITAMAAPSRSTPTEANQKNYQKSLRSFFGSRKTGEMDNQSLLWLMMTIQISAQSKLPTGFTYVLEG